MKKLIGIIAATIIFTTVVSCSKDFKVTYLEICPTELTTTIDDTVQMTFSIVYEGGNFDDPNLIQVNWESSNTNVVEVSDSGKIVTKSLGEANIMVSCQDMTSTCSVTVVDTTGQGSQLPESQFTQN